ncbi:MAG TPA: hypothetical protein VIG77_08290 [Ktedonobacterales bacterium]|jgi:phosphoenolpyruvate synthase/pyruvate phosphate dikinase
MRTGADIAELAASDASTGADANTVAQVFVVPIYSTLSLDTRAYERFLTQSGALNRALRALNGLTFAQPQTAENARKQIQSIVMAAEVNHIVRKMSA